MAVGVTWLMAALSVSGVLPTVPADRPSAPMPAATAEHRRLIEQMEGCVWSGVRRELIAGARTQDQIVLALDYCRARLVSSGYMTPARAGAVYRETLAEALQHITDSDPAAGF